MAQTARQLRLTTATGSTDTPASETGYQPRALVQLTLPHRDPKAHSYVRTNGRYRLQLVAPPDLGLPFGSYPRLALAYFTTHAVRTRSPRIYLGESFRHFMESLGIPHSTGAKGSVHRFRAQLLRLSKTTFFFDHRATPQEEPQCTGTGLLLIKHRQLWESTFAGDQNQRWESSLELTRDFYEEIVDRPVPIRLAAIKRLSRSPLALDAYCWLTYRMSYLKTPTRVPWQSLEDQFGSGHLRTNTFARELRGALRLVSQVYPEANVTSDSQGLILRPSPTHVPLTRKTHILPR